MGIESISWYIALGFGLILFLYGIIYLIRNKGIREEHFAKAAVFEFMARWIMFIPKEVFSDIPESNPALCMIESIFTALLKTFGNGYERISYEGHPIFSSLYTTLIVVANVVFLLFVGGFIIKFFEGPLQRIKLTLRKKRDTYIFPAYNDKCISIAKSIRDKDDRCNIVFAGMAGGTDSDTKQNLDHIHAIYVDLSVTDVISRIGKKSKKIQIFLFNDSETRNLTDLKSICDKTEGITARTHVYVELSETPWGLYDDFLKENNRSADDPFIVNFVRTEENFIYNDLLGHSIFENAVQIEKTKDKVIRFLIIGMNERGIEMFKTVLHLSQMPGYRLDMTVVDDKAVKTRINSMFPEIKESCDEVGDAVYQITYKENVDYGTQEFNEILNSDAGDFTFAFVCTGNDLLNADIAMRLNAYKYRKRKDDKYRIQVNISDHGICDKWSKILTEKLEFVGSVEDVYNYDFITMSDIEEATMAIHEERQEEQQKEHQKKHPEDKPRKKVSWIEYCNNEYNRHSVYARTLSFKYKVALIVAEFGGNLDRTKDEFYQIFERTKTEEVWRKYEHMRWNMYTRTMGYVLANDSLLNIDGRLDKTVRFVAKVHNDLIPFEALSDEEKNKDGLTLTRKIVDILLEIPKTPGSIKN